MITLTESQKRVFKSMKDFIYKSDDRVFLLKGYAGTGKTTLMRFLIDDLNKKEREYRLLASTGRAAKVLGDLSGNVATTIHGMIYTLKDLNKDISAIAETSTDDSGQLFLVFEPNVVGNETGECVYIVDEASMIGDLETKCVTQAKFGTGRLLKELLHYDQRKGSKFIFVGDPCQLPPVSQTSSPALDQKYFMNEFRLQAQEAQLTEIMRQGKDSSLITVSQDIRRRYSHSPETPESYGKMKIWGERFHFRHCRDIQILTSNEVLLQNYVNDVKTNGFDNAIYLCRSNNDCYKMSLTVRAQLGFRGRVCVGDQLMVVQNNLLTGLVNGDMVEVVELHSKIERRANQDFRRVKVKNLFDGTIHSILLMESLLDCSTPNVSADEQTELFKDFAIRMHHMGIKQKRDEERFREHLMNDEYLNALRCMYGYAVTCHKAQGGEWNNVYLQMPRNLTLNPVKGNFQWLYTAITRAKKSLSVVRDFFID